MKNILFLTGTRADFGKLKPLIGIVDESPEFNYQIFVTGMHTLSRYGSTYIEIQKAGFKNIHLYINQDGSINSQMDLVLANTIQGFGHFIREFKPDLIVIHGDRIEAFAGAIVGALNNVLVAHVEGGEVSGTIDELIRHSVTKLSHIHFVANDESSQRIIQMGENPKSVVVSGSPEIDVMLSERLPELIEVKKKYEIEFSHYFIFIYHPVTTEIRKIRENVNTVLKALESSRENYVVIYPNNDAGSDVILESISKLKENSHFRLIPSMRFEYFLTLLKNATGIIGNSSTGVREAPVYGVPAINIGTRQLNRFKCDSIVNVLEDEFSISNALRKLPQIGRPSLHFGVGNCAQIFIKQLQNPSLWETSTQKQFCDIKIAFNQA